jgi:T5orf172 domain
MLGKRVPRACRCGAQHREYFEIEATAEAVREVDGVIRQWIEWGERRYGAE